MTKSLFDRLMSLCRRDRFIYGITVAILLIALSGATADFLVQRYPQAGVQLVIAVMSALLLFYYSISKNYTVFVYSGIVVASVGYNLLLCLDHFALHSYLILMIIPLVIFFILPLRQAFVMSLLHYGVLIALSWYGYAVLHMRSEIFGRDAIQVYLFGGIFILAFGSFYHLAIEESYRQLQHANRQKETLLKEIHHRIKNNLNKMSSALGLQILRLQQGHTTSPEEILRGNKLRIEAMSLVHEALYRSEDIANVDVGEYIRKVLDLIERTYERQIRVEIDTIPVFLPTEKILRLGTILNELYTNTIKHTDADNPQIGVEIILSRTEDTCMLRYVQKGNNQEIDTAALTTSPGLGMMLIQLSAEEMDGTFHIETLEKSLVFSLTFDC